MNNQAILWSMLILPWLTLFFMRKEDFKRFFTVALLAAISALVIADIGTTLHAWAGKENIFPLGSTSPITLGLFLIVTLWLFKFTYGRLWLFIPAELVLNLGFAFILEPWLIARGIHENILANNFNHFLNSTAQGILLYIYQMWQEDALVPALKKLFSAKIQPATTKPIFEDEDNKDDR